MSTITLEEAQARLPQLIDELKPGEALIIMRDQQPVAKLIAEARPLRKLGQQPGSVLCMAPDFDAPLEDFQEYMQ